MMLDPLAEVRIRMLMAVGIGSRQLVMHLKSRRNRSQGQQSRAQDEREDREDPDRGSPVPETPMHRGASVPERPIKNQAPSKNLHFLALLARMTALSADPGRRARPELF